MSRGTSIFRATLCLLAWLGVLGFLTLPGGGPGSGSAPGSLWITLSAYTIQTNLMVGVWLAVALLRMGRHPEPWILKPVVRGAITTYITVTFVVFAAMLESTWDPEGWTLVLSVITHYAVPIGFIVDWGITERRQTYSWDYLWRWLLYPLGYFVFSLVNGAATGRYLYPFLDVSVIGWGGLALSAAALTAFFALLSAAYIVLNRRAFNRRGWAEAQRQDPDPR